MPRCCNPHCNPCAAQQPSASGKRQRPAAYPMPAATSIAPGLPVCDPFSIPTCIMCSGFRKRRGSSRRCAGHASRRVTMKSAGASLAATHRILHPVHFSFIGRRAVRHIGRCDGGALAVMTDGAVARQGDRPILSGYVACGESPFSPGGRLCASIVVSESVHCRRVQMQFSSATRTTFRCKLSTSTVWVSSIVMAEKETF